MFSSCGRKKAQIGTTITWVVAFFIILFLMIGFIVIATALSGKSKAEINFEESVENLNFQRELMKILNSPVEVDGKEINIKELINLAFLDEEKYKEVLESEIKKVLKAFEFNYWDFEEESMKHVAFAIIIYFFEDNEIKSVEAEIEADEYSFIHGIEKLQGKGLAGVYVPVSDSEMFYIVLWASQEERR